MFVINGVDQLVELMLSEFIRWRMDVLLECVNTVDDLVNLVGQVSLSLLPFLLQLVDVLDGFLMQCLFGHSIIIQSDSENGHYII